MKTVREVRRARRYELRCKGIQKAYRRRVWCVEVSAIAMPEWARARAVKGLTQSATRVWLRPRDARMLARIDREAGGEPAMAEAEFRRCGVCNRPLLGLDAAARRELDESAVTGRQLPCGGDCLEAARDKRWSE